MAVLADLCSRGSNGAVVITPRSGAPLRKALIDDTTSHVEVEDVHTGDEWALIRWRYVWVPP